MKMVIQGREVSSGDIHLIRQIMTDNPKWGRTHLSQELCIIWNWRAASGLYKDMACRSLLLKLEKLEYIELPPRVSRKNNLRRNKPIPYVNHERTPIECALKEVMPVKIVPIGNSKENIFFSSLLFQYHYLGYSGPVGENMKYLVFGRDNKVLACLLFGSSSDTIRKNIPGSLRISNGRKSGGQNGHKGNTLKMVDNPDKVINHPVDRCEACSRSLKDTEPIGYERRQVFDIPPLKIEVEEHRYEIKDCSGCGHRNKAELSKEVSDFVQYGERIKSFIVYLMEYHLMPYERTTELIEDVFGHSISEGTLYNTNKKCYEQLEVVEERIKEGLVRSPVVNFDETGLYCNGRRDWMHSASTPELTFYAHHCKRGREAMDEIGILPQFKGTAVHDYWKPYLDYPCFHALCNGHLLRELTFVYEQYKEKWANGMINLLIEIKEKIEKTKPYRDKLEKKTLSAFEAQYNKIVRKGLIAHGPPDSLGDLYKRRGRKKQSRGKNLLDRLKKHRQKILAFMYNFLVPFDNNLVERDIRMTKVQQKISGCFRSEEGADFFCRIRGYISTVKKHNINVLEAIQKVFAGNPFIPQYEG